MNVQWQPRNDLAITIGYSGNRGRHSVIPIPFNEPGIATASNPIYGETDTYGFEVLNQNTVGDAYYDYSPILSEPWNSEDGGNADFRTPYIGYSPNAALFKTVGRVSLRFATDARGEEAFAPCTGGRELHLGPCAG